jgi:hypothetical protein
VNLQLGAVPVEAKKIKKSQLVQFRKFGIVMTCSFFVDLSLIFSTHAIEWYGN